MVKVNLKSKSLIKNNIILILNGTPQGDYKLPNDKITIEKIESLYQIYKHSVPNKIKYRKPYFKALSEKELSVQDLITGANRQQAKENLETTLLIGILNGSLTWPDETKWFWQSKTDKDLILLKSWF